MSTITKVKKTRNRKPKKPEFSLPPRGDKCMNWLPIAKREIQKRVRELGSHRLQVVEMAVTNAIKHLLVYLDLNTDTLAVNITLSLPHSEILDALKEEWDRKLLSNWSGPKLKSNSWQTKLWEGKNGYWKLCKNWADQNKYTVSHIFWCKVFQSVQQYCTDIASALQHLPQNAFFVQCLKFTCLYAIFASKVGFPKTRLLPLLVNTVIAKNGKVKKYLREHFDDGLEIIKWKEQESDKYESVNSTSTDNKICAAVKRRCIQHMAIQMENSARAVYGALHSNENGGDLKLDDYVVSVEFDAKGSITKNRVKKEEDEHVQEEDSSVSSDGQQTHSAIDVMEHEGKNDGNDTDEGHSGGASNGDSGGGVGGGTGGASNGHSGAATGGGSQSNGHTAQSGGGRTQTHDNANNHQHRVPMAVPPITRPQPMASSVRTRHHSHRQTHRNQQNNHLQPAMTFTPPSVPYSYSGLRGQSTSVQFQRSNPLRSMTAVPFAMNNSVCNVRPNIANTSIPSNAVYTSNQSMNAMNQSVTAMNHGTRQQHDDGMYDALLIQEQRQNNMLRAQVAHYRELLGQMNSMNRLTQPQYANSSVSVAPFIDNTSPQYGNPNQPPTFAPNPNSNLPPFQTNFVPPHIHQNPPPQPPQLPPPIQSQPNYPPPSMPMDMDPNGSFAASFCESWWSSDSENCTNVNTNTNTNTNIGNRCANNQFANSSDPNLLGLALDHNISNNSTTSRSTTCSSTARSISSSNSSSSSLPSFSCTFMDSNQTINDQADTPYEISDVQSMVPSNSFYPLNHLFDSRETTPMNSSYPFMNTDNLSVCNQSQFDLNRSTIPFNHDDVNSIF
eukprot:CAMPEP_0197035378 /NCGR_PEP_ID=MMETSP1384-20130603/13200_1 /TAXON_ID=29189 /ORGANISM="Ammonia sp." /LENGTH=837 /DNA_ID=CAMNT_0042465439 /DNA_START=93 /DNA_END=2606 /DNA_ORIENTATION=+